MPPLRRSTVLALAAGWLAASAGSAQERRVLPSDHAQAQLVGYFAAVMAFTPVAGPGSEDRWLLGGTLAYIPRLSRRDLAVGFGGTKAEDANLCPAYPRLTAARRLGDVTVEAGWTPPLRVCGVRANVGAAAIGYGVQVAPGWAASLRASGVVGTLEAAITCSAAAVADAEDLTCSGGAPSRDRVRPLAVQFDAVVTRTGARRGAAEAHLLVGVRRERVDVDVRYVRAAGGALPPLDDDQGLRATLTRLHAAVGVTAPVAARVRLGGELYVAPGALVTLRGGAALALGAAR